jgi:hypothetical protein
MGRVLVPEDTREPQGHRRLSPPPFGLKKQRHERRHSVVEVGRSAQDVHVDKFRPRFAGDMAHDARAQRFGVLRRGHALEQRDVAAVTHHRPALLGLKVTHLESGLFEKLATEITREIEHSAAIDVVRLRRSARKIKKASRRRIGRHLTHQISTISSAQRRRNEEITDAAIGKLPIPPRTEAGVVGLEASAAKHSVADGMAVHQQDTAVPNSAPLLLQSGEMPIDLAALIRSERPLPTFQTNFRVVERGDFYIRRARR